MSEVAGTKDTSKLKYGLTQLPRHKNTLAHLARVQKVRNEIFLSITKCGSDSNSAHLLNPTHLVEMFCSPRHNRIQHCSFPPVPTARPPRSTCPECTLAGLRILQGKTDPGRSAPRRPWALLEWTIPCSTTLGRSHQLASPDQFLGKTCLRQRIRFRGDVTEQLMTNKAGFVT